MVGLINDNSSTLLASCFVQSSGVYIYMFIHTIYSYTYIIISTYTCLLVYTYNFLLNQIFLATHKPYKVQTWYCTVYVSKASLFKSCIFQ